MAGGVINAVLSLLKLVVGLASGSAALVADAGHSLSDLVSDGLCMWAQMMPAWDRAATLGISFMLVSTGATMLVTSARALGAALGVGAVAEVAAGTAAASAGLGVMDAAALFVALTSVASKEALFRVTHAVGKRQQCKSLVANAHHHRSDALSSVAATVGIGGSIAGFGCFDPLAALIVGGMVLKMGFETACSGCEH